MLHTVGYWRLIKWKTYDSQSGYWIHKMIDLKFIKYETGDSQGER